MYTPSDLVPELTPFVEGEVWTARAPLRFFGVPMGCRMTVCRLSDGRLFVHSPIDPGPVGEQIDALGRVAFVVAPNFLHHLYAAPFRAAYPDSKLFVSPRLIDKRSDLQPDGALGDAPPEATWGDTLDQAAVPAGSLMDEVVFLHRPSRTLLLCDLCMCVHTRAPWAMRQFGRIAGVYDRYGPPRDVKLMFRDRRGLARFVERVLDWDFDAMLLAHGDPVTRGAKDVFRQAYAFCL